jgi:predicted PurR-regulated permease PerM
MTTDARQQTTSPLAYRVIAAVALFAGLYLARDLLIPIALAIFLAFLLAPLVRRIQGWGLRRGLAVFVLVALTFSLINFASCFVGARAMSLVEQLPKYRENIVIKARSLRASVGETLQPVSQTIDAVIQEIAAPVSPDASNRTVSANGNGVPDRVSAERPSGGGVPTTAPTIVVPAESSNGMTRLFRTMLVPLLNPILTFALSAVFAVFFLIYREDLRDRIIGVLGDGHIGVTTTALSEAGERVSRYFGGLMITNCLNGAAIAVGLLVLGVPDAIVFGVVAAVLRFVPFLGPWIAAAFPTALSLAFFQGWTIPVLVVALFVAVDQFSANVMEPWFYGTRTGASPTAIILSMIVWTWLWGAIGLLLATPITVCLVVLGKYVSDFTICTFCSRTSRCFSPMSDFISGCWQWTGRRPRS